MAGTSEYGIWNGIMMRCYNKARNAYSDYGGRGITVCKRWHKFENFFADMGKRPSRQHTIDRYPDLNGNYEPSNCRWATMKQQGNNRRSTVMLTHNGVTRSMKEWEQAMGLSPGLIHARIKIMGWSVEDAITKPARSRIKPKTCQTCGKEFLPRKPRTRFCSMSCRRRPTEVIK